MRIRVLFDDAFFSIANSGIASYWTGLLKSCEESSLFEENNIDFKVINRSGAFNESTFELIDFPALDVNRLSTDIEMLEKLSNYICPDLFISSYYTYVPGLKSLGVIYDLIPEVLITDQSENIWKHRINYFHQVTSNIAISEATRRDLINFYPFKNSQLNLVLKPGVSLSLFKRSKENDIINFRRKYDLGKDSFVVLLGSRYQKDGYKNARKFFEGLSLGISFPHNVVCIGGEELTKFEIRSCRKAGVKLYRLNVEKNELPICLSAAICLVYPSLYEGFGMPVIETLAVGTPVVTGSGGGLIESGGSLAIRVDVQSGSEILKGIDRASELDWALHVKNQGPEWAAHFSWQEGAKLLVKAIIETHELGVSPRVRKVIEILKEYHNKMRFLE